MPIIMNHIIILGLRPYIALILISWLYILYLTKVNNLDDLFILNWKYFFPTAVHMQTTNFKYKKNIYISQI